MSIRKPFNLHIDQVYREKLTKYHMIKWLAMDLLESGTLLVSLQPSIRTTIPTPRKEKGDQHKIMLIASHLIMWHF